MNTYTAEQYSVITSTLKTNPVNIYKTPDLVKKKGAIGYVYQDAKGRFNVFIDNNASEEVTDALLVHEVGHIFYHHASRSEVDSFIEEIREVAKKKDMELSDKILKSISNVCLDLEVNSKLLTLKNYADIESSYKVSIAKCIDLNVEPGLRANEYIESVLEDYKNDPDKYDSPSNTMLISVGGEQGGDSDDSDDQNGQSQGESQDSSGGSDDDKDSDKKTKSFSGSKNSNEPHEYNESDYKKGGGKGEEDTREKANQLDEALASGSDIDDLKDLIKESYDITDIVKPYLFPSAGTGTGNTSILEDKNYVMDLVAIQKLRRLVRKSPKMEHQPDSMKLYNRNCRQSNLMYTSTKRKRVMSKSKLCILVDVSGSMSHSYIIGFIRALKHLKVYSDSDINIVTWDTRKTGEFTSKDFMDNSIDEKIIGGGGTTLAPGVKYLTEKYHPTDLFVFTDMGDRLSDIDEEIRSNFYFVVPTDFSSYYKPTESYIESAIKEHMEHCNGYILYGDGVNKN